MSTVATPSPNAAQQVLQLSTGYIISAALQAAVKLRISDRLAAGPASAADLASAAGVQEDALYRVLRALAMVGVFAETAPRTFALTPAAEVLQSGTPGSVYDMVLWMTDPFHFRIYAETLHSVRTGETAVEKVTGLSAFDLFARDQELSAVFNNAMTSFSASIIPAVLKAYDFSGIDVLVDVAGGHGEVLMSILQAHPRMRGVLFDVDHVIRGAVSRIEERGLAGRCEAVAGDFFAAVPGGGDAYLMKHIIHDWDDERAGKILGNIRSALQGTPEGKVLLLEGVIQSGNEPDLGKLIDIEMLVGPGGRERTAAEFEALFARAGFELVRIVPTESPVCVLEGRPR
jgi:hypothetical protein